MDEKQLQLLYNDYAKNKGFKNYSEFRDLMSSEGNRKIFFDDSNKDLGFKDYNEFVDIIGVKKKAGSQNVALSFPIQSVSPLQKGAKESLQEGAGLAENSFLKQINNYSPLKGLATKEEDILPSSYKPIKDISIREKKEPKQYYNAPLEKGVIFTDETNMIAPGSKITEQDAKKIPLEVTLKNKFAQDYIEKIRKEPTNYEVEGAYFDPYMDAMGGIHLNIAQNAIDQFISKAAEISAGVATGIRDFQATSYGIEPEKISETATWSNDPLGKVVLGLNGIKSDFRGDLEYNGKLPNTMFGKLVSGGIGIMPDIAGVALLPEVEVFQGAGMLSKAGKFFTKKFPLYLGGTRAIGKYGEEREMGKTPEESVKGALESGVKGYGEGLVMELAGIYSGKATTAAMKPLEKMGITGVKGQVTKEGIQVITDAMGYGALVPLASAGMEGKLPTADEYIQGVGLSLPFSAMRIYKNARTHAQLNEAIDKIESLQSGIMLSNFVDATTPSILEVYKGKESAAELNLKSLEFAKKARETTDLKLKQDYITQSMLNKKAANVKQIAEMVVADKNGFKEFRESDLPEDVKKAFLDKASEVYKELNPTEQQKTDLGKRITQAQSFVSEMTKQMEAETDPVKKAELKYQIDETNKLLEKQNTDLTDIIAKQAKEREEYNKPEPEETETTNKKVRKPSQKKIQKDIENGNMVSFTYASESEVPQPFKDKIVSTGETNGVKFVRVTVPKSVADYELSKIQEVNQTDIEAKKADIEKRRQEELNDFNNTLRIQGIEIRDEKGNLINDPVAKINAKYDAELAFLEGGKAEVKPTEEKVKEIGADIINNTDSKKLLPIEEINNLRTQKETDLATGNAIELERDLLKNGIKEPLVVTYYPNEGKARLTDGHNRLDVAKDMGAENLPIRIVYDYGEAPSSAKDFVLPTEEVKPTDVKAEVKVEGSKAPTTIPEEVFNPIINKIKKGIQKLSDTAKVSVLKGKNFAKALEEAIKTGGVNLQSWGGFEKKGFEESPQWKKLIDDGTVKLNFDIKGLEGKPVVVINPDNMLTGEVVTKNGKPIVDGNGGINFVTKFGDVWASSDNATANTLARYINEARQKDIEAGGDGTVHVVVTKGDLSKSLTSHTGAKAAMKVLEHFVDKKLVSLSDFRKALTEVGKKYGIDFDGRMDAKAIHDDIAKKFFGVTDSTFSKRGFFVQDIIDHLAKNSKSAKENIAKIRELLNTEALPKSTERKTGEISFAKEGIIDAIGHLLSDNMTVGVKNSEAYATIEIKHPVEVFNLNKEEGGHESYPFHLRQIDENGNKVKPVLNVLRDAKHVTDILNDANNSPVDKKGGAGKFGSNQIGMAKGFVKPASEHPTGVNMMTDATGKIYGFEQNGKIVLNADLMNGNTPFHEAGHLWLSWAKENRSDLHDAGMQKIENSKYLKDVKNNKVYQDNAAMLPEGEREAYLKSEALAKAIGDNGEKFVTETQKSDFKKWVKELWETVANYFGLRDMTAEQVSEMTLDEFSKKVVADIVGKESEKGPKFEVEMESDIKLDKQSESKQRTLADEFFDAEKRKSKISIQNAKNKIIKDNFGKIVEALLNNNKIDRIC